MQSLVTKRMANGRKKPFLKIEKVCLKCISSHYRHTYFWVKMENGGYHGVFFFRYLLPKRVYLLPNKPWACCGYFDCGMRNYK